MIAKTAERRRDGRQKYSYRDLVSYIAGGGDDEKTIYTNHRNLTPISDSTEEIIKEMEACGVENPRAKNKIHHGILSWREGEVPTKEQVEEAVSIYLQEMGLENCQCYYGLHKNTDNLHLHICVNKIDPATHKSIQPAQGFDYKANERISRRIELAQGWEVLDRGEHYEVIDGEIFEKDTKKAVPNLSTKAADYENLTSAKSAERIAQERCASILFNVADWQSLHKELADVGCRFEKKGSGAVLFVGDVAVKLSKVSQRLSLKKMEKRLGAFEEPKEKLEVKAVEAEPLKKSSSSEEYLKERKEYYNDKLTAREELKRRFNVEYAEMKARHSEERKELFMMRSSWKGQGVLLNALRSELAWKQLQERKEWHERKSIRLKLLNESFHKTFPSYTDWLIQRGKKKEADFWRYRESLSGILTGDEEIFVDINKIRTAATYKTEIIEWGRNEKGNRRRGFVYRENLADTVSFVDTGRRIDVVAWQSDKTLRDALELAQQKWGGATVNGSKEYVKRCVDIAARYGIKINNPELQEEIQKRRDELAHDKPYDQIEKKSEMERSERMNKIEQGFAAYNEATQADRYRITAFYTGSDGKPRAYVFDKDKLSSAPSPGYTYEELRKEVWKIEKEDRRGKNIYVTPISKTTHHILIDDLTKDSLKRMIDAGYRPSVIVESSRGNFQALINVPKLHERYDKEISNLLMKKLNKEFGDKNIQGAVHPHRVAGTHNHKPSRRLQDGTQPEVKLVYAAKEKTICRKAQTDAEEILRELQKMERERQARLMRMGTIKRESGKNITAYEAYMAHARDIMNYRSGAKSNLSVVDSMVAVRMYVTGWSVSDIERAIAAGARELRSEADQFKHNWPDYAKRTAHYPETMRGSREVASNRNKERAWLRVEGRTNERGIER